MNNQDKEFEKRLLLTFRIEAEEYIRDVSAGLIELGEGLTGNRYSAAVERLFRDLHSLKGAARSIGQREIEGLCQPMESVFSGLKRNSIAVTPGLLDLLHVAVNALNQLLAASDNTSVAPDKKTINTILSGLNEVANRKPDISVAVPETIVISEPLQPIHPPRPLEASVRIPSTRLDPLLVQAEELIISKIAYGQRVTDTEDIETILSACNDEIIKWKAWHVLNHDTKEPEFLSRITGHMISLTNLVDSLKRNLLKGHHDLGRLVDDHLDGMKELLMMPVSNMSEGFPKLIRDLARDQGKEVSLIIKGAEVEIDKRILDELKDPMIHLLRNAVDHAMQQPKERNASGKPNQGAISISFTTLENHQLEILVSDDGKGIDTEKLLAKIARAGFVQAEEAKTLTAASIHSYIFSSGVSTTDVITDLSGRGLGLAIAREKVEKSGGTISVESRKGEGTTFRITMPLTLTTFRGILLRSGGQLFMMPATYVESITRIPGEKRVTVENRNAIIYGGKHLSVANLSEILGLQTPGQTGSLPENEFLSRGDLFAILRFADFSIACQIDEVLSEQQFLLKSLGPQLRRVRNIAGATILGTGEVVPVLNVADLVKTAMKPVTEMAAEQKGKQKESVEKKILVAEDSITSRMLFKNILESSGFTVNTAVDGMDAWVKAREGNFDLIISDVDMPRMNGFEFARKIRADKKLSEIPFILVTSLISREDREQGIEAGANAYIVKSSFEQSNLLSAVKKLI